MTAQFYLGTHQPGWLRTSGVPLFVSDRRLRGYKTLPRAKAPWALDSGGFTELSTHGSWSAGPTPRQYAERVRRYRDEIGGLMWAAPQDWMCEPWILTRTGLSLLEHQRRTIDNYRELRETAPDLPFVPVLQGWHVDDYLACADLYAAAGVDLRSVQVVGLGSVCRRQATSEAVAIIDALRAIGITQLHGFGFKVLGLRRCGHRLASADSMAWSVEARRSAPLPGCQHSNCANCRLYAHQWRHRVLGSIPRYEELALFDTPRAASSEGGQR
ncbi:DUF7221 family queuine tRNA-ribosyltransferase-like protein [Kribbella lupini]|uniref:DeoxyPurine in DNA protein A domain-containing protein n=1 Tax=Kribbella lupini TaxID=291602 RepID=A0ABN2B0U5_9ACTN